MRRLALVLTLAAPAAEAASGDARQGCHPIALDPGATAREVAGVASPRGAACFAIEVAVGQRARIQILEGEAVFSVEGLVEAQEDYAFVAQTAAYRLRVGARRAPDAPSDVAGAGAEAGAKAGPKAGSQGDEPGAGEPFVMRVSLSAARPAAPGGWLVEEGEGRAAGLAWIAGEGGPSFGLTCAAGPEPRATLTFDGLGTAALARGDAEGAPAWIEIDVEDERRRHPVRLARYDGFDRYWEVTEGFSAALLRDFAKGSSLRLVDAEGSAAGEVGLAGSARLRAAIARRCGL